LHVHDAAAGEREVLVSDEIENEPVDKRNWVRTAVAVSGWVAAVFMGLLNLPAAINSFKKELPTAAESTGVWAPIDKRFDGAWAKVPECQTNPYEIGDISGEPLPGGNDLDFKLKFEGARVNGEIISDQLRKGYVTAEVEMIGETSGSTAKMRVFDWIDGKATTLANADITRVGDNCLKFETVGPRTNWFPQSALMTRETIEDYDKLSRKGELIDKVIADIRKDSKGGRAARTSKH
jgi:hypothetical protein